MVGKGFGRQEESREISKWRRQSGRKEGVGKDRFVCEIRQSVYNILYYTKLRRELPSLR